MSGLLGKVCVGGSTLGLTVVALLFMAGTVGAQGGEGAGECTFLAQVQDNTCGDGNCPTSSTFSPNCDDIHKFAVQAWCLGMRDYAIYRVTAYLYDLASGQPVATLKNWDQELCGGGEHDWNLQTDVQLYAGHIYYIKVCLDPCYGHDCDDCTSAGYVLAKVYHL